MQVKIQLIEKVSRTTSRHWKGNQLLGKSEGKLNSLPTSTMAGGGLAILNGIHVETFSFQTPSTKGELWHRVFQCRKTFGSSEIKVSAFQAF